MSFSILPRRSRTAGFGVRTSFGHGVRFRGRPTILTWGDGRIELGDRVLLASTPVPSHLFSAGVLLIGNDVTIGHGAAVAATRSIVIGDRTRLGPFCLIMDTDFHGERARVGATLTRDTSVTSESGYAPIEIGSDVKIGAQVTVLRGSRIGDGAVIEPGSVVNGRIAAGAVGRGVPAREVKVGDGSAPAADRIDVARIVARTFALAALPGPGAGPEQIPEWDSLGSLKLVFSLEEALGRAVDEHLLATARTVEQLQSIVDGLTRDVVHEQ